MIAINLRFILLTLGIFCSFFVYGVVQESVLKGKHGPDEDKFDFVLTIILVQTVFSFIVPVLLEALGDRGVRGESAGLGSAALAAPRGLLALLYLALTSATLLLAMASSYMALRWVSYPTQVVAKASKPIPVLIMGVLIGNKSFTLKKYFTVLLIVVGVALFMFKDTGKPQVVVVEEPGVGFGVGELLLLCSLAMDGISNGLQERLMANYRFTSNGLMKSLNRISLLYLSVAYLATGELFPFLAFVRKHPTIAYKVLGLGLTNVIGCVFIFKMLVEFGTLPVSIVTTTRKFFTVLGSILIFGNSLIWRQWVAVLLVFGGLFLDSYVSKSSRPPAK